jgi:hypothetical protein
MKTKRLKEISVALSCLILPMLAVSAFAFQSIAANGVNLEKKLVASDITLWQAGENTGFTKMLQNNARDINASVKDLSIKEFVSNPDLQSRNLNRRSVIIFDGTWLNSQKGDDQTIALFNETAQKVGGFLAVGVNTQVLTEVAEKAGIYTMTRLENGTVCNPLNHHEEVAGIRLVQMAKPGGGQFYYARFFSDSLSDPNWFDHLLDWIGKGEP